ncbi:60S ribosomal protein L27-3 [Hordeum vulgare]|nr:60S ribosomal protein L27-3 [Hordeum vulgare]
MMKFPEPGKAVILLQGRYAKKKAVIVRVFEESTRDRPYGYCLVAGLAKYFEERNPQGLGQEDGQEVSRQGLTQVHQLHPPHAHPLLPRRQPQGGGLQRPDSLTTKDKKLTAAKSAKAKLEERFKTGKNMWFFTKLRKIRHDSRNASKIYSSLDST